MLYKVITPLILSLSLPCCLLYSIDNTLKHPMTLQLQQPHYKEGVMYTEEGGVLQGQGFHLQGRCIRYTKKIESDHEVHAVSAHGDLMLDYHGHIFLGDSLEYDFVTQTGRILNGTTSSGIWFIHGATILLNADKSFEVIDASITTSEDNHVVWKMTAEKIHLTHDNYLVTKNIQFKCLNIPILWIPYFKSNVKKTNDSPLKYSLSWDAGQGPKISLRYRVYSWDRFNIFLRGDYRYARGPGGALEMDYTSEDKVTVFQSKNYIAHDTFYNDDNPNKKMTRFRLQGLYKTHSQDRKGHIEVVYDKISDKNMPGDFKGDDFELNTAKQTRVTTRYFHDQYIAGVNIQPRINPFDGFKQELPELKMGIKALKLGSTPLILNNDFNLAYLDYVYSNQLSNMPPNIAFVLKDFHAVRAETHQELYLPLHFKGIHFTPRVGAIGILYNNNPDHHSVNQLVLTYGGELNTRLSKTFQCYQHDLIPYVKYTGLHRPIKNYHQVYIFDINDGYHELNMIRFGINNCLYTTYSSPFLPKMTCDLYALGFLADHTFNKTFPKAGIFFTWNQADLSLTSDLRWNFNNHVLDFANFNLGYTVNANIALNIEYRHRSKFDWRKDNHQNFILDVTQTIPALLDSPLSDGRNVLLTKAEFKLTPRWLCRLQMHNGWGRRTQPGYTEARLDLFGLISSAWKVKLSYMYTTRGASHFGFGLDLVK